MRFVIHHHQSAPEHYAFMLERDGSLETFRLGMEEMERLIGGAEVPAERVQDQEPALPSHECPMSCDRGRVRVFDEGLYKEEGLSNEGFCYMLLGKRFSGCICFCPSGGNEYRVKYYGC
ncbi:MAG: hypothetical protein JXA20_18900 [Spirochaetes bacterium]|nr:hypothetical protein [Spirochaetota bacterium]